MRARALCRHCSRPITFIAVRDQWEDNTRDRPHLCSSEPNATAHKPNHDTVSFTR